METFGFLQLSFNRSPEPAPQPKAAPRKPGPEVSQPAPAPLTDATQADAEMTESPVFWMMP